MVTIAMQTLRNIAPKIVTYPKTITTPEERRFPYENSTELLRLIWPWLYLGFGFNRPFWPSAPVSFILHLGLKDYCYPFPPCYSIDLTLRLFKWMVFSLGGVIQYLQYYSTWNGIFGLCLFGIILRIEFSPKLAAISGL